MTAGAAGERVAGVLVKTGIFILKYVKSESEKPPRVFVQVSPSSRDDITILFVPGKAKDVIEAPNDYAVVCAEREGHLQLTVVPYVGGGSNARIQLEPLKVGAEQEDDVETTAQQSGGAVEEGEEGRPPALNASRGFSVSNPQESFLKDGGLLRTAARGDGDFRGDMSLPKKEVGGFSIICHVAKQGDISVGSGEWIGGPGAPAVIEGVLIDWSPPPGALLEYQVLAQDAEGRWSAWASAGEFAGSRGRGVAIVGLRIRLSGRVRENVKLTGQAVFLGCPVMLETGKELEFISYAGIDPMVGLRLRLEDGVEGFQSDEEGAQSAAKDGLKVFKAKRSAEDADELPRDDMI